MSTEILSQENFNKKIKSALDALANTVGSTLGPKGKLVLIKPKKEPSFVTKDGVTVAKSIKLKDPTENAIAEIIKQSSEETANNAGDGTTTSMVLTQAIWQEAHKLVESGFSIEELKQGILDCAEKIKQRLKENAIKITSLDDIKKIAMISANNDEQIGDIIAQAVDIVGKDGSITIEEGRGNELSLETYEGYRFDSGLFSNILIADEQKGHTRYEDCYVLVTDFNLVAVERILPIMDLVGRDDKPLVIVADNIEGEALAFIVANHLKRNEGGLKIIAVKSPGYGEQRTNYLDDIALTVGAKFISRVKGDRIEDTKLTDLGQAKIVEANRYQTTLVSKESNVVNDAIEKRLQGLYKALEKLPLGDDAMRIQERITRLSSAVAVIKVGAATQAALIEKKHRIDDALQAVYSAHEQGFILGGGCGLLQAVYPLDFDKTKSDTHRFGVQILYNACHRPFQKICDNAGISSESYLENLIKSWKKEKGKNIGLNARTKELCNMLEEGIIDPVKVTLCAVENSVSAALNLLSTNYSVIYLDD